jgi:hypothetical protein
LHFPCADLARSQEIGEGLLFVVDLPKAQGRGEGITAQSPGKVAGHGEEGEVMDTASVFAVFIQLFNVFQPAIAVLLGVAVALVALKFVISALSH